MPRQVTQQPAVRARRQRRGHSRDGKTPETTETTETVTAIVQETVTKIVTAQYLRGSHRDSNRDRNNDGNRDWNSDRNNDGNRDRNRDRNSDRNKSHKKYTSSVGDTSVAYGVADASWHTLQLLHQCAGRYGMSCDPSMCPPPPWPATHSLWDRVTHPPCFAQATSFDVAHTMQSLTVRLIVSQASRSLCPLCFDSACRL